MGGWDLSTLLKTLISQRSHRTLQSKEWCVSARADRLIEVCHSNLGDTLIRKKQQNGLE